MLSRCLVKWITGKCFLVNHFQTIKTIKNFYVLGQSHTLECKTYFPFEITFSPEVQWYMHYGGDTENPTLLQMESKQ